jgi:serine/threonine protein kinase
MSTEYQDDPVAAQARLGSMLNGRWRLEQILAAGGSAWVYVATDASGRNAAAKVLHRPLAEFAEVRKRFVREARIADLIAHDGVVRVLDDGETEDGVPFLVLELLEGETLEARAARKGGRLPLAEVMWAADQLLDVLSAAHKKGIVHRDVKPENLFLTTSHRIKLLDFGIARLLDLLPSEATKVGTLLGTLDFMAPEQARGEVDKVGVQADLWSVGATMFRLLTGRRVHEEKRIIDQIEATMSKPAPPLRQVAPEVPEPIALMVDFALQFDAPRRWPNARAMKNALMVANAASEEVPSSRDHGSIASTGNLIVGPPDEPPFSVRMPNRRG